MKNKWVLTLSMTGLIAVGFAGCNRGEVSRSLSSTTTADSGAVKNLPKEMPAFDPDEPTDAAAPQAAAAPALAPIPEAKVAEIKSPEVKASEVKTPAVKTADAQAPAEAAPAEFAPPVINSDIQADLNGTANSGQATESAAAEDKAARKEAEKAERKAMAEAKAHPHSLVLGGAEIKKVQAAAKERARQVGFSESRDGMIFASRKDNQMRWALASTLDEEAVDHFELLQAGSGKPTRVAHIPANLRIFDLSGSNVDDSSRLFVKAIEKSGKIAHISNTVTLGREINLAELSEGASVVSPIHVVASAISDQPVTAVQVYLDDLLVSSEQFDHIDAKIAAEAGARILTVTGWDLAGNEFKKSINVNVRKGAPAPRPVDRDLRGMPVVQIQKPTDSGSIGTHSAHLVADAAARRPIVRLEVYRDDQKLFHTRNTHLDTNIPLSVGSHKLTVKAYDKAGNSYSGEVYVERLSPSWAWDESAANSEAKDGKPTL